MEKAPSSGASGKSSQGPTYSTFSGSYVPDTVFDSQPHKFLEDSLAQESYMVEEGVLPRNSYGSWRKGKFVSWDTEECGRYRQDPLSALDTQVLIDLFSPQQTGCGAFSESQFIIPETGETDFARAIDYEDPENVELRDTDDAIDTLQTFGSPSKSRCQVAAEPLANHETSINNAESEPREPSSLLVCSSEVIYPCSGLPDLQDLYTFRNQEQHGDKQHSPRTEVDHAELEAESVGPVKLIENVGTSPRNELIDNSPKTFKQSNKEKENIPPPAAQSICTKRTSYAAVEGDEDGWICPREGKMHKHRLKQSRLDGWLSRS